MPVSKAPILEDERCLLRPLKLEDVDALWSIAQEPELWTYMNSKVYSREDLAAYIAAALREQEQGKAIPFLIVDKNSDEVAGSTRYLNMAPEHKRLEIGGTWIGKRFQGTGLNKHMKFMMLEYAFEIMGYLRVELKTDERNLQSQAAMRSLGATQEGTLRKHMIASDGWVRNSVYFSIIDEEWPDIRDHLLPRF